MNVKFLGTKANIETSKPYHAKHSGILIDSHVLFELGERSFLHYSFEFLFFTHFHPDHAFFIKEKEPFQPSVPCYGPEDHELCKDVEVIRDPVEVGPCRVEPVPTIHSHKVKSQGYILEKNGKRILYTGDVAWILKDYHDRFGTLDLVIADGSFMRKGGMIRRVDDQIYGHTGVPDLIRMFKMHTQHIIFTHLGNWFVKDAPKGRRKFRDISPENLYVEAAYDGKSITV
jgi:ribonuclease BN (tRNA processing enzyme)